MQYYYITEDGVKHELSEHLEIVNIYRKKAIELVVPEGCKEIQCSNNKLKKLQIPKGCKEVYCQVNEISEIEIPAGCEHINLNNNKLKKLHIPEGCNRLACSRNELISLVVPSSIRDLECENNFLEELLIPDGCKTVNCDNNKLNELIVPSTVYWLSCGGNKIKQIRVTEGCHVDTGDTYIPIIYNRKNAPNFGQTNKVISDLILKIKNPVLWSIADGLTKELPDLELTTKINIKQLKKIANSNPTLAQMLSKKEGQALLKANPSGFSIADIQAADFYNQESLFQNKFIEIAHDKREGDQRYFKEKDNHVFQVNLKAFKNEQIITNSPNKKNLNVYINKANHPTSRKTLTLARVRYTYLEDKNTIVIDEIQTDLDDNDYLGKELMIGREEFTLKLFIQYVRKQYKIRKIYMPTYDSKKKLYHANPPMYLYKELPNKFGFKKTSDFEGFMVLEKFELPSFEDYSLI